MKKALTMFLALMMSVLMAATAFAGVGSWNYDGRGWKWRRANGSVARNQWLWIDGNGDGWAECYCFDNKGYMMANTYYDDSIINSEGKWVDESGEPFVSDVFDEYAAVEASAQSYPYGTFRYNSQTATGTVKITRSSGTYYCEYEYNGYTEDGMDDIRILLECPLYQDGYNSFKATDSYGDTLTFSYYGGKDLYNVSYDGSWGEVYTR